MMQLSVHHEPYGDLGIVDGIFILGNLFSTLDYATLKRHCWCNKS
jgi:hypothetical protein